MFQKKSCRENHTTHFMSNNDFPGKKGAE